MGGAGRGALVVGDDQKLRVGAELGKQFHQPAHVLVVEGGIDLVEDAERRWTDTVQREQQRHRGEGALAAGQQGDVLQLLAWRLGVELDAGFEQGFGVGELELGAPAAEQAPEHALELAADIGERLLEQGARLGMDLFGDLAEIARSGLQIVELAAQELVALVHLAKLLRGHQVHLAELAHFLAQPRERGAQLAARLGLGNVQFVLGQVLGVGLLECAQGGANLGSYFGVAQLQPLDAARRALHLFLQLFNGAPVRGVAGALLLQFAIQLGEAGAQPGVLLRQPLAARFEVTQRLVHGGDALCGVLFVARQFAAPALLFANLAADTLAFRGQAFAPRRAARAVHLQVVHAALLPFDAGGQFLVVAARRFRPLALLRDAGDGGAQLLVELTLLGHDAVRRKKVVDHGGGEGAVRLDQLVELAHLLPGRLQALLGAAGAVFRQRGVQILDQPRDLLLRRRSRFRRVAGRLQPGVEAGHDVVGGGAQPAAQLFEALILHLYRGVRRLRHLRVGAHAALQISYFRLDGIARVAQFPEARCGRRRRRLPGAAQLLKLHDAGGHAALAVAIAGHAALRLDNPLAGGNQPLAGIAALQIHSVELALQIDHLGFQRARVVGVVVQRFLRPAALLLQQAVARAGRAEVGLDGRPPRLQLAQPDQLQVALGTEYPLLHAAVLVGALDLVGEQVAGALHLGNDRIHLRHVGAGVVQLALRLGGARPVAGDAGGLFEHLPPLLRLGGEQHVDAALLHHRVGVLADPGVEKYLAQVAQPHRLTIDEILALAGAVQAAPQLDLGDVHRQRAIIVVQYQRDFRYGNAAATLGTAEDHIVHALRAQRAGVLLAEHPANGVHDIALAAAVRSHNGGYARGEIYDGTLWKRFEAE